MNWSELAERIELKPRYVLPVFALASLFLLAPTELLATLGLEGLAAEHGVWMGLTWAISGSLLLRHALLPIFVAATVLLFSPSGFLELLGIGAIATEYRLWIGITWIASGSPLLSRTALAIYEPVGDWLEERKKARKASMKRRGGNDLPEKRSRQEVVGFPERRRPEDSDPLRDPGLPKKSGKYQEA